MKRIIRISFLISTTIGFLFGLVCVYAAWEHNPQCEFHCNGYIDWLGLFAIWSSWFVMIAIALGMGLSIVGMIMSLIFRRLMTNG